MSPRLVTPTLLLRKSDAELCVLVAAGDDAAFSAIVLRHRAQLLRHCRSLLRDQRAEDAVQQTFLKALQALRSGSEVRELGSWLHRIARNVALSEVSAGRRNCAELDDDLEDRSQADEYDRRVALRETLVAVDALPDRQRVALLRAVAGETPEAIGRELGVSSMAVRQLVHRARVSVRAAVRAICPPPLIWLSRRAAAVVEKIPREAGAPAGAAPLASKLAATVIVSATVAAPATLLHGILTHHPRRSQGHPLVASAPAARADAVAGRQGFSSPLEAPPAWRVDSASPAVARTVHSRSVRVSPNRVAFTRQLSRGRTPSRAGVSAWSPNSGPVGAGSGSADSSFGPPVSTGSPGGPTASASASAPTQASTAAPESGSSTASASGPTSTDASAAAPTASPSGATAGDPSTTP